jgi:heme-degrading monooxygenase HmoA
VVEINTVFDGIAGCLQRHVLKQEGATGDSTYTYLTIVEWASEAAIQEAREAAAAKHKEMNWKPQEMRLHIKAELGNYVPLARETA